MLDQTYQAFAESLRAGELAALAISLCNADLSRAAGEREPPLAPRPRPQEEALKRQGSQLNHPEEASVNRVSKRQLI